MIVTAFVALQPLVMPGFALPLLGLAAQEAVEQQPDDSSASAETIVDERERWRLRERALLQRIAELENALREEQERSLERQQEWIAFTRLLRGFELPSLPDPPEFVAEALAPDVDPVAEAVERERARLSARAKELTISLKSLLIAEGMRGIDVLEVGFLHEHEGRTWTGPVIARLLDDRGRMMGMLKAARMRLETSHASRTVTILFEEGYESRSGFKRPFDGGMVIPEVAGGVSGYQVSGGVRRVFLGAVDPAPWIESMPELIDPASLEPLFDDGLWDLATVRVQLVRLLRDAAAAGDPNWRLVGIGGILADDLRDVQFAELDPVTGRAKRRVFADTARLSARDGGGIELRLEGGSVRRGDRVAPFLAGRYRIVLPRADAAAWRAAQLPGLSAPPLRPATEDGPKSKDVAPVRRPSSDGKDGEDASPGPKGAKDTGAGGNETPPVR